MGHGRRKGAPNIRPNTVFAAHLPNRERDPSADGVHAAIQELAMQTRPGGAVRGANARCTALLTALRVLFQQYSAPADKKLQTDLSQTLTPVQQQIRVSICASVHA